MDARGPVFDPRLLLLDGDDNVVVLAAAIGAGETVLLEGVQVTIAVPVARGHKLARRPIAPGDRIIKHGAPIGSATQPIARGEHVHVHNIRSDYTATYLIG